MINYSPNYSFERKQNFSIFLKVWETEWKRVEPILGEKYAVESKASLVLSTNSEEKK